MCREKVGPSIPEVENVPSASSTIVRVELSVGRRDGTSNPLLPKAFALGRIKDFLKIMPGTIFLQLGLEELVFLEFGEKEEVVAL